MHSLPMGVLLQDAQRATSLLGVPFLWKARIEVPLKEVTGNLWDYWGDHNYALCVTTNGTLKRNGEGVMGRGCAKELCQRYPDAPKLLGQNLKVFGNNVQFITEKPAMIVVSFPVKHNWWEKADLALIRTSAKQLKDFIANGFDHKTWILPRPGCGNGKLDWKTQVKPLLGKAGLPDNVWVISPK